MTTAVRNTLLLGYNNKENTEKYLPNGICRALPSGRMQTILWRASFRSSGGHFLISYQSELSSFWQQTGCQSAEQVLQEGDTQNVLTKCCRARAGPDCSSWNAQICSSTNTKQLSLILTMLHLMLQPECCMFRLLISESGFLQTGRKILGLILWWLMTNYLTEHTK